MFNALTFTGLLSVIEIDEFGLFFSKGHYNAGHGLNQRLGIDITLIVISNSCETSRSIPCTQLTCIPHKRNDIYGDNNFL